VFVVGLVVAIAVLVIGWNPIRRLREPEPPSTGGDD